MSSLQEWFHQEVMIQAGQESPELLPSTLARAAAVVLGYDGAGLCLMSEPSIRVPLGASDELSAAAEQLQFTVGEGPCFEAFHTSRATAVSVVDMRDRWPALAQQHFAQTPFRGGLSVPLLASGRCFGVLDFYLRESRTVDESEIIAGQQVADAVTKHLRGIPPVPGLKTSNGNSADEVDVSALLTSTSARRREQVWVAVGMASLSLRLFPGQALAVLRSHAYGSGRTLDDLAGDIMSRKFDLAALWDEAGI